MIRAFVKEGVEAYVITECSSVYDPANKAARVAVRLAMDALGVRANPNGPGGSERRRSSANREPKKNAGGARQRILFATDLHGSDLVFRKFLNSVSGLRGRQSRSSAETSPVSASRRSSKRRWVRGRACSASASSSRTRTS